MVTAIWIFLFGWATASELHWLAWVTFAITVIHTGDECFSSGGPIWEYLQRWAPLPWFLMFSGYAVFQTVVISLGFAAWAEGGFWIIAAVGQRLFDVGFTHTILRSQQEPNPGHRTAFLLLIDAGLIAGFAVGWGG